MKEKPQGYRYSRHDYRKPWYYMITMAARHRKPLFATYANGKIKPTEDGMLLHKIWEELPQQFPKIATSTFVTMPDHVHGIIRAKEYLDKAIGAYLGAFKAFATGALRKIHQDPALEIWEPGYHDWRVAGPGSLDAFTAYIRDNPRRYCLKQQHPDLFTRVDTLAHPRLPTDSPKWSAYGNLFLLDRPVIIPLRVSRSITTEALAQTKEDILHAAAGGAVIISPFISPGEKSISLAILDENFGDVIIMKPDAFAPGFKPHGRHFNLCANGRLLILNPFDDEEPLTKARCEKMNAWCREIANAA